MSDAFIPEHEVYALLTAAGVRTPRHVFIEEDSQLAELPFEPGEAIVVKGVARDLWHKSDVGALSFLDYHPYELSALHGRMRNELGERYEWLGTLVAERRATSVAAPS